MRAVGGVFVPLILGVCLPILETRATAAESVDVDGDWTIVVEPGVSNAGLLQRVALQDFGAGADRATTGRGYVDADLETLSQAGMASGFASVLVLALYIDSMEIQQAYSSPMLVWFLCPLVLYIIVRIWVLARRQQMHDDPVVFILRDWRSQMMIGFGALMFMAAAYV